MLRNYITITFRNLIRNKVFIFINIAGMGVAIACCIIAFLNWDFSNKFDHNHKFGHSIYRVQSWQNTSDSRNRHALVPTPLGLIIKQNFDEVTEVVRYTTSTSDMRIGDEVFNTAVAYADSAFFDTFTFSLTSGSFNSFHNKSFLFISNELARKYFNTENAVGKQITQINGGELKEFTIGGVFETQPLNSSFAFEAITLWDNYWDTQAITKRVDHDWRNMSMLFVRIDKIENVPVIERRLQAYLKPQNQVREDLKLTAYYLQSFRMLASNFYGETWLIGEQLRWGIPPSAIIGPVCMAIFLLLLACFNFTNTSISIAGRRLKEIGIRKTMGGVRSQLVLQFLNESIILCFLSLLAGLLIAEILVPAYNSMWTGIKLTINYSQNVLFFVFLGSLLLFTAILAGTYPAFYVSSFKPVTILKGKMKFRGTNWFTRSLLTFQFAISLACIVCGIAFVRNAEYQNNFDLGYTKSGIITAPISNENEFNAYRNALSVNKDIRVIAGSRNHVSDRYYKTSVRCESIEHQVEAVDVGDDYLRAMNISLVHGRGFENDSETDKRESALVSEEFVKQFGWTKDVIGKRLLLRDSIKLYVIGVIKDIHTEGFWKPVAPVMIRYIGPELFTQIVVNTSPDQVLTINDFMREEWKKISPNTLYGGKYKDGNIDAAEMINTNTLRIFSFLGIVAVLMSVTGLYAMLSLNIQKRMKEIGVRKMLGASAANISKVINLEFFLILSCASLLGGGLGFMISDKMMDAIWEYYLSLDANTVIVGVLMLFFIAAISVGYKTAVTSKMNPIQALRDE